MGIKKVGKGMLIDRFFVSINLTISFLAGLFNGASFSFQSGINSLSAVGSKTLPDRIWAPISEPFSIKHMERSLLFSLHN